MKSVIYGLVELLYVKKGIYDLKSPPFDKISEKAKDLIKKTLTFDYNKRISAADALNHPWFKENKSKELFNKVNHSLTIRDLITNLKSYKRTSIIQETALAYLVHHFPHIKDVVNACKLFNQMDHSADGKISKNELYKGLSSLYQSSTLQKDVDEIYKNLDMDNSGYIGYEEFVRGAVNKQYFTQPFVLKFAFKYFDNGYIGYEEFVRGAVNKQYFTQPFVLKFAFKYFDKDNSGEITFDEIEKLFYKNIPDKKKVHDTLKAIIKEVDINNDKKISYREFSHVMQAMIK